MIKIEPVSYLNLPVSSIGGVTCKELARTYGTPLYVLDEETFRFNISSYYDPLEENYPNFLLVYACKANQNLALLNILADMDCGVDVVSGGELAVALRSQIDPKKILFHGNNKSIEELTFAIENNVTIIIDNLTEWARVKKLSDEAEKLTTVMLRLKPEIEAHTHDFIKTGQIDSKFGMEKSEAKRIITEGINQNYVQIEGLHSHIGSQILDIEPYLECVRILTNFMASIKSELGFEFNSLNIGGGLGIRYEHSDDPPEMVNFIKEVTAKVKNMCNYHELKEPRLILEPGRSLVGNAGVTLYTIGTIKDVSNIKRYLFIDGGMADNLRPQLYQAKYTVTIADKEDKPKTQVVSIAGKFCESGDILIENIKCPDVEVGDLVVVFDTGAYNASMASNYNKSTRPATVLVYKGTHTEIIKRETLDDLLRSEIFEEK